MSDEYYEKYLKERICPNCNFAIMDPHPEFRGWLKCKLCGYCKTYEPKSDPK